MCNIHESTLCLFFSAMSLQGRDIHCVYHIYSRLENYDGVVEVGEPLSRIWFGLPCAVLRST